MVEYIALQNPLGADVFIATAQKLAVLEVRGSPSNFPVVMGAVNGRHAHPQTFCFVDRELSESSLRALSGAVVLTTAALADSLANAYVLVTADPRALFIDLVNVLSQSPGFELLTSLVQQKAGIHPMAEIHPQAVVEDGVAIGIGSSIAAGCVIKSGTSIGERVIVRENTVIGCAGIALYKTQDGRVLRFPHLAGVHIGDDTEIGANCVIPRGMMSSGRIGRSAVIGNLCNIGHGACIGDKVWMSVGTLVGGNSSIGTGCTLGMGCTIRDNITIGERASIGMGSVVVKDIDADTSVFGNPAKRLPNVEAGPQR